MTQAGSIFLLLYVSVGDVRETRGTVIFLNFEDVCHSDCMGIYAG